MQMESLGGSRYFILFTDDHTRMSWVYFINYKAQALGGFKKFKLLVEEQCDHPVKILCTDRGDEFLSNEFNQFCEEHGIARELTTPYTLEQNGVA